MRTLQPDAARHPQKIHILDGRRRFFALENEVAIHRAFQSGFLHELSLALAHRKPLICATHTFLEQPSTHTICTPIRAIYLRIAAANVDQLRVFACAQ